MLKRIIIILILMLMISCDLFNLPSENSIPNIYSFSAEYQTIYQENTTLVTCLANDPDSDILNYRWETTGGNISGVGSQVTYIAPLELGNYRVNCYIDDRQGGCDTASLTISVIYHFKRDTIADIDGNLYKTVRIGNQWWMAENLKVMHYNNGDAITKMSNSYNPDNKTGVYADVLNNDNYYREKYGLVYNYFAVADVRGLAPEGWHVSTDQEWSELEIFIDSIYSHPATSLIMSEDNWEWSTGGSDDYEFCAYPVGGYTYDLTNGGANWSSVGYNSHFWTASEYNLHGAWRRDISLGYIAREYFSKHDGYQVRCVKDKD